MMNAGISRHWAEAFIDLLTHESIIPKDFIGQVEVNVFKGGITNVNIHQSFKKEDTTK